MLTGLKVGVLLTLGAALLGPLMYALHTLLGLRRKLIYPLLRVKRPDGRRVSVMVEGASNPIPAGLSCPG